jgi:hypothetical protein
MKNVKTFAASVIAGLAIAGASGLTVAAPASAAPVAQSHQQQLTTKPVRHPQPPLTPQQQHDRQVAQRRAERAGH